MRRRYQNNCFTGTKVQILTVLEDINAYLHEAQVPKHLLYWYKSTSIDASCSAPQLSTIEEHLSRTAHERLLPLIESAPTAESETRARANPLSEALTKPLAELSEADDSRERAEVIRLLRALDAPARERAARLAGTPC